MTGNLKKKQNPHHAPQGDDLSVAERFLRQRAEDRADLKAQVALNERAALEELTNLQATLDSAGINIDLSEYRRIEKLEKAEALLQVAGLSFDLSAVNTDELVQLIADLEDFIQFDKSPLPFNLFGDDQPKNDVLLLEPEPLNGPDAKELLALENLDHKTLAAHVAELEETDPAFVAELVAARTARHAFSEAASAADASQPVPDKAPRLWSERDKRTEKNPAEFIRSTYAFCMANLGQHHLLTLDRGLYRRYVDWKDEPKELVNGKIKPCDQPVKFGSTTRLSDEERGRRAREQSNTTKAKKRAQQKADCDILPHLDP